MKATLSILALSLVLFSATAIVASNKKDAPVPPPAYQYAVINGYDIPVWTVKIDGKEYLATRVANGFSLCPKIP
jgi:hypothetical protein